MVFSFGFTSGVLARPRQGPVAAALGCPGVLVMAGHRAALWYRLGEQRVLRLCFSQHGGCQK